VCSLCCLLVVMSILSSAQTIRSLQLTAYNTDGTNAGTGRLSATVQLRAAIKGTMNTAVVWRVLGAGSISSDGLYQAPDTMPPNPGVTITATLAANPNVSVSYKFTLLNAVPVIYNAYVSNGSLLTGITNILTIHGAGFVPSSLVVVNGAVVPTSYQSRAYLLAQVTVPVAASGTLSLTIQTPAPGGDASSAFPVLIAAPTLQLTALSGDGLDSHTIHLGLSMAFVSKLQGAGGDSSTALPVTWRVQGSGSISSSGLYQAPDTMPPNASVTVIAALAANPSLSATYQFFLLNAVPVITGSNPAQILPGQNNSVTIYGLHFVPGVVVSADGIPIPTTYETASSLLGKIALRTGQTGSISMVALSPDPNIPASNSFIVPIGSSASTISVRVDLIPGMPISQNFLGLSHEWSDPTWFIGNSTLGTNPIYLQMIRNLMLGSIYPFSLRIGGGSTDSSSEPSTSITTTLAELAATLPVHYSLGVNLGFNNLKLATDQARFYLNYISPTSIDYIEIGNEPDEYAWNGLRRSSYTFTNYLQEFGAWQGALAHLLPYATGLMGPSWGELQTLQSSFPAFESHEAGNIRLVDQHYYAGYQETEQAFPDDYLLSPSASTAGSASVANAVVMAHGNNQLFRMGEINSIDGGGISGISDSFSSALWAVDTMFEYANVGVDGVNWHGLSGCAYCPFTFAIQKGSSGKNVYTLAQTHPLYYGMLFFQMAAANGSRLLPVTTQSNPNIKIWSTLDRNGGVHVVIINKDRNFAGNISVSIAGYGVGNILRLIAPRYNSKSGVTIGGQTFDGSVDGTLVGPALEESLSPLSGSYTVAIRPMSAVLLTLPH